MGTTMTNTLTAHNYKAPWKKSQTTSSLLLVISHVNKRQRNKNKERKKVRKKKGSNRWSRREMGKDRQEKIEKVKEIRVCLEKTTNGCQGRGSYVPVSMATRMCCRCSDASWEHCAAAVLT